MEPERSRLISPGITREWFPEVTFEIILEGGETEQGREEETTTETESLEVGKPYMAEVVHC